MFKEGEKNKIILTSVLGALFGLSACSEIAPQRELPKQETANRASFDKLRESTEQIEKRVVGRGGLSEEERKILNAENADVIAKAAEELCKSGSKECSVNVVDQGKEFFVYISVDGLHSVFSLKKDGSQLDMQKAKSMIEEARLAHNLPF